MHLLDDIGKLNIRNVVRLIRSQRAFAVQMPDQYVFCFMAILTYAQQKGMLSPDLDITRLVADEF